MMTTRGPETDTTETQYAPLWPPVTTANHGVAAVELHLAANQKVLAIPVLLQQDSAIVDPANQAIFANGVKVQRPSFTVLQLCSCQQEQTLR